MPATSTGLLTIDAIALDLNTPALNVLRLIAKKKLAATSLSPNMQGIRVLATELQRYIAAGAPGFEHPRWANGWFQDDECVYARACERMITAACENQTLDDATVIAAYNAELAKTERLAWDINKAQNRDVELKATPEVINAANQPISKLAGWISEKYLNHFQALCVSRLRSFARASISLASLEKLYTPEFAAISEAAATALKAANCVVFSKPVLIPDGGATIRVTYTLKYSAFQGYLSTSKVIEDSF